MFKNINIIGISVLFLYSCSLDTSRIAPGYIEAFKTLKNTVITQENEFITPEIIEKIPYASMTLKIGRGVPGLVILESIDNGIETWVSADGVYLLVEEGRIIRTAGLFNNLINFSAVDNNFSNLIASKGFEKLFFYYSYDQPELNNMRVVADRKFIRKEMVEMLGSFRQLYLIEERISNSFIGWSEVNKFWVDDNNFVWKSEQFISPKLPRFNIEITKKLSQ